MVVVVANGRVDMVEVINQTYPPHTLERVIKVVLFPFNVMWYLK